MSNPEEHKVYVRKEPASVWVHLIWAIVVIVIAGFMFGNW